MSRYYRHNPDEEIRHDWLEGVPRTFQDVKRVMERATEFQEQGNRALSNPATEETEDDVLAE